MRESRVSRENFITISGWMITDLHLKGNELLIYAIIYGYSQADAGVFNGSLQYLADWTASSKESVRKCLKSLVKKNYIIKKDVFSNNIKYCEYRIQQSCIVSNKVGGGIQQSCMGVSNKVGGGIQQSCTNNIEDNITNNILIKENIKRKSDTDEEFEKLWSMYPRKDGKKAAKAAYESAVKKGTTFAEVEKGIKDYLAYLKRENTLPKYIKKGDTYFRGEHWTDEYDFSGVNNSGRFNQYGGISGDCRTDESSYV